MTTISGDAAAVFRSLHHVRPGSGPLVLPGPWDAASARAFADAGFRALATPSAGLSAVLGYADGSAPADEMFAAVARIVRAVAADGVMVTADLEDGYGLPPAEFVERLLETGAVGCNLEDSDRVTGLLKDPAEHAERLSRIRAAAGDRLVINARADTFLRGDRSAPDADPAIARCRLYAQAGADCVFPILAPAELLPEISRAVAAPVNAIALPNGPSPRDLGELGAARVTFGGGLHRRAMAAVADMAAALWAQGEAGTA
ncbi:carboxyvinyl-carboxyphosphonate phosphorylmutase [Streptosporangium nondiastaticum]|uniref:Carboxyvinyl-carboxyphosphonate phosphorylmutase n=1 Tax=Streptosporangium nondiastaticum TaxID=35764 RepID=A0A9X7JUD8_9ACTN|nr:isocitrate lyase/phosphoenolpyruvate mutase family protein [Streptosporangium nondiastaticum]PSJ30060.1 carboxyvinyl-carboxyphosphonate phosphorylmutase [Streptosporangium nondiastaticum]